VTTIKAHLRANSVKVDLLVPGAPASLAVRRIATTTLGCKINAYESRMIENAFTKLPVNDAADQTPAVPQWLRVEPDATADVHVINTCTVTAEADRQARQAVRKLIRRNPDAVVVVTGCYAQMSPDACAEIPGVDFVVGNDRKLDLAALLPRLESGQLDRVQVGDLDEHVSLPEDILTGFDGRTRAFVQIQQGCNQGCTFCIIHQARGPSRSLPATLIRRQVERLVMNGYGEIVLCGVDLGSWGMDFDQVEDQPSTSRLADLVRLLDSLDGEFRIRLSSIDPVHLDEELIQTIAASDRVCPHIHLSMQSGSTLILKRMKRRATRDLIDSRIEFARRKISALTLSADIMTGFPTESDAHFLESVDAVRSLGIAWPHVFPYSARAGTPAARIPRQVDVSMRKSRAAELRQAGNEVLKDLLEQQIGQKKRVLVERASDEKGPALARADDYCTVRIEDSTLKSGQFLDIEVIQSDGKQLFAG